MSILPDRPRLLKPEDPATIDATLRVIELIQAQELHFNNLCAGFKRMASTWLLATFAGIGFLLSTDIALDVDVAILAAGVAAAGAVGIYLLWIVDLLIYQRLLSSAFTWRGRIEKENPWLPPLFDTMRQRIFGRNVGFNLVWFYMLGVLVPALICLASLALALRDAVPRALLAAGLGLAALALAALLHRMHRESAPAEARAEI
jgi:hypothetical protein